MHHLNKHRYLVLFDTNRPSLSDFYHDSAVFSLAVNPLRQASGRGAFSGVQQQDRIFDAWWPYNRNLEKVKQAGLLNIYCILFTFLYR